MFVEPQGRHVCSRATPLRGRHVCRTRKTTWRTTNMTTLRASISLVIAFCKHVDPTGLIGLMIAFYKYGDPTGLN